MLLLLRWAGWWLVSLLQRFSSLDAWEAGSRSGRKAGSGRQTALSHLHMCNYTQMKNYGDTSANRARHAVSLKVIQPLGSQKPNMGVTARSPGIFHLLRKTDRWGAKGEGERVFLAVMVLRVVVGGLRGGVTDCLRQQGRKT